MDLWSCSLGFSVYPVESSFCFGLMRKLVACTGTYKPWQNGSSVCLRRFDIHPIEDPACFDLNPYSHVVSYHLAT